MTSKFSNGRVNYFQFKNGEKDGYGIITYNYYGNLYRGEFKNNNNDGYGLRTYESNDKYDGQWKRNMRHGEAVFKNASTGRVERRQYFRDKVKKVLEVIEQGH
jgi:hypothetical protein